MLKAEFRLKQVKSTNRFNEAQKKAQYQISELILAGEEKEALLAISEAKLEMSDEDCAKYSSKNRDEAEKEM